MSVPLAPTTLRNWPRCLLLLPRGQHAAHDGRVQFVFAFADIAVVVRHAQDEDWQRAFLVEILSRDGHRQHAVQTMLAVGGFVAMLSYIPGEDADLIVVIRQAVVGFSDDAQIL